MVIVRKVCALIFLLFVIEIPCLATDYWVDDVSGSDANTGLSAAVAWKTLGKANATVQAGDTVYVLEGTYDLQSIAPANAGTGVAPIVYKAVGYVMIQRGGVTLKSYVTIDGFEIRNGGTAVYGDFVAFVKVRNCRLINNTGNGIYLAGNYYGTGSSDLYVDRCLIANNGSAGIATEVMNRMEVTHTTIANNGGSGISLGEGTSNRATNSIVAFNGRYGLSMGMTGISDFNNLYSNLSGSYVSSTIAGPNDLAVDPQFIDPAHGIFLLKPTSPLIGKANDCHSIGAYGVGFVSAAL